MRFRSLVAVFLSVVIAPAAELPVRTIVLYKHGVGFFERSGPLNAGESARLDFDADSMNDVLKSLTVVDQGGKVNGLRYDSSIPLEQKLNEFPFRIGEGQPLSAVIDQLKGARVEMEFGPQKVEGAIVSARLIAADKDHAEREQLTLLMDSGDLRNVDLAAATSIHFTDVLLQLQFKDYLAALTSSRSKDKRSVYIDSTDAQSHDVRASYIMPMPAWKSSYRLLLDDTGTPTIEGWELSTTRLAKTGPMSTSPLSPASPFPSSLSYTPPNSSSGKVRNSPRIRHSCPRSTRVRTGLPSTEVRVEASASAGSADQEFPLLPRLSWLAEPRTA